MMRIRSYSPFCGITWTVSKAKILLLWVDEAEPVSANAWTVTIPTVREEGAEIWVTWNPDRKKSATHIRFRLSPPDGAKIVEMNWRDNPFFPKIPNTTRLERRGLRTVVEGAYYSKLWLLAKEHSGLISSRSIRLCRSAPISTWAELARADAVSILVVQFVGQKINVLDYYEAQGRPLSVHLKWMRDRGWGKAWAILPHDGAHGYKVFATSYESAIREAGFDVLVIPNQGAGAASARIETARRHFPRIFFNAETAEGGRDALGWYDEKKSNDDRNVWLGPNHDWRSHAADGFGLMCIHYDQPDGAPPRPERYRGRRSSSAGGSWQSA